MKSIRNLSYPMLLLALVAAGIATPQADVPRTIRVGEHRLVRVGLATRSMLFGFVELYTIGLYLPGRDTRLERIRSKETPKALMLEVDYEGDTEYGIPESWRDELLPVLGPEDTHALRQAYGSIKAGDMVTISYVPKTGTRVAVNDRTVFMTEGQAVMAAFLDNWLGQQPVSEDIKSSLLGR